MEWCRDFKFQITRLEWERIFLHFEIDVYKRQVQFAILGRKTSKIFLLY